MNNVTIDYMRNVWRSKIQVLEDERDAEPYGKNKNCEEISASYVGRCDIFESGVLGLEL